MINLILLYVFSSKYKQLQIYIYSMLHMKYNNVVTGAIRLNKRPVVKQNYNHSEYKAIICVKAFTEIHNQM